MIAITALGILLNAMKRYTIPKITTAAVIDCSIENSPMLHHVNAEIRARDLQTTICPPINPWEGYAHMIKHSRQGSGVDV